MNIGIEKAIKLFFPNPSFPMVFFEAVANAFDADANNVDIKISIPQLSDEQHLNISIEDNGTGFTDERYERFSSLLETMDNEHKGVGRLVYLIYFETVEIESWYGRKKRTFTFDRNYEKGNDIIEEIPEEKFGTKLTFSTYLKGKLGNKDYLQAGPVGKNILFEFLSKLYLFKQENKDFKITVELKTNEKKRNQLKNESVEITKDNLPQLNTEKFPENDFFATRELLYDITKVNDKKEAVHLVAYSIDGRSYHVPCFNKVKLPDNYRIIFILQSGLLDNKTDSSRTKLELDDTQKREFEQFMIEQVTIKVAEKIPSIKQHNESIKKRLHARFPHLIGYFADEAVGLVDEDASLSSAQAKFFEDQKEILNAEKLTKDQYDLALIQASRVLSEYILYRNFVIQKLKSLDIKSDEETIHNILIPMKNTYHSEYFSEDMFINNVWVLDDKYMNYSCVLSDKNMNDLLHEIAIDGENIDDLRPDIAIVFSRDITVDSIRGVDVVIVELKKKDGKVLDNARVIDQLRQRAGRLIKYYGIRIQRIWYYGIVGFSTEFRNSIRSEWKRLYSNGDLYYKEFEEWAPDNTDDTTPGVPVGYFLNSYDAICNDAKARNEAFLNILRASIKKSISKTTAED